MKRRSASPALPFVAPAAPQDRGPLLTPEAVAALLGRPPAWVRRHVPGKLQLGRRTVRWYESDVWAWIETIRRGTK